MDVDCPVRPGDGSPLVPPPGDDLAHVEPQDEGQGDPAQQGLYQHLWVTRLPPPEMTWLT